MRVSGFTIANHAVRLGYPLEASLRSMLPIVDEMIVNIGEEDQATWDLVARMQEPKIKPFRSHWSTNMRYGGLLLAEQTNLALERCQGDWGLYLQADEVLHENDYDRILKAMEYHRRRATEVLRFRYHHFYGSFNTVQDHPRRWYSRAGRAVKLGIGVASWGDAMDFCVRRHGKEWFPRQGDVRAFVYHYGWVRPPQLMRAKNESSERLYYEDDAIRRMHEQEQPKDVYWELGNLRFFRGTHPATMREIVASQSWRFDHGIEKQPPDWIRHARVWTDLYVHRAPVVASNLGRSAWRAMLNWKPRQSSRTR
jgi:hypothetical protein